MSEKQDLGLGKIIEPGKFAARDAIHIAVAPMIAGEKLHPGDHVRIMQGTSDHVVQDRSDYDAASPRIGIVDPFIELDYKNDQWEIPPGSRIWVYLYPNTITGLRHEWDHPAFSSSFRETILMPEAERWLRQFADRWNFDYQNMIDAATNPDGEEWGAYITARGIDLHSRGELGEDHDLFWKHLETMTGKTFNEEHREKVGWSCSC
jgi:hypothetical protein